LHAERVRPEVLPEGDHRLREHPRCRQGDVRRLLPDGPQPPSHLRRDAERPAQGRGVAEVPARERHQRLQPGPKAVSPRVQSERRIDYAGSVHDEREIEAVVEVLRGGPTAMRIGKNVRAMEQRVAELFGKRRGIMCNSGSSALYLAVEVLGLQPGDEIVTSAVTFSTDIAPMIRAGLVPAFVDVTPTTFQIDVDAIEAMIGPKTKAILAPN